MGKEELGNIEVLTQEYSFEVKGRKFVVTPVYLDEIDEYYKDNVIIINSDNPQSYADTVKLYFLSDELVNNIVTESPKNTDTEKKTLKEKIYNIYCKLFHKYEYKSKKAKLIKKWIERKFILVDEKDKKRKIKFEELERKYLWNKGDVGRALNYLAKVSGF